MTEPANRMQTGRPTKFLAQVADQILVMVECGVPPLAAAKACGVPKTTCARWLEKGKAQHSGVFRDFRVRFEAARSKAVVALVARISHAARGTAEQPADWRAAAWLLERMDRKRFGLQIFRTTSKTTKKVTTRTRDRHVTVESSNETVVEGYEARLAELDRTVAGILADALEMDEEQVNELLGVQQVS